MSRRSGGRTRRDVLVAAAGGVAAAGALLSPAQGAAKLSKVVAKYQDHPHGQQHCAICLQFRPPDSCHIVAGTINPNGWCQFFAAKENAH
ncbi:MAG: hypothetical protein ACREFJ_04530 [Acetobacteraceae bacterium]